MEHMSEEVISLPRTVVSGVRAVRQRRDEARRQHQQGGDDGNGEADADLGDPQPAQRARSLIAKETKRPLLLVGECGRAAHDPHEQRDSLAIRIQALQQQNES